MQAMEEDAASPEFQLLSDEEIDQVAGGVDKPIVVKGTLMKISEGLIEYGH